MEGTQYTYKTSKAHMKFWLENLKERNHLKDLAIDWEKMKLISKKHGYRVWTGYIWFRVGTGGTLV
jgi:hypothetical protein